MAFIREWVTYVPTSTVTINGKEVPAPSKDEDEVSMAYEVLSKLDLPTGSRLVFVVDDHQQSTDFHIVAELIESPTSIVSTFTTIDDAIEYSLNTLPSVLVVVRTKPPAGSAAIMFRKRGPIKILAHEFRKESMGFLKTTLTDERALSDLLSEIALSKMPGLLRKFFHSKKSKKHNLRIISGYLRKEKILIKAVNSLKLKNVDISPALEVVKKGFEGNLAAAFSMISALERCEDADEVLFVYETSGGIYALILKRDERWSV